MGADKGSIGGTKAKLNIWKFFLPTEAIILIINIDNKSFLEFITLISNIFYFKHMMDFQYKGIY